VYLQTRDIEAVSSTRNDLEVGVLSRRCCDTAGGGYDLTRLRRPEGDDRFPKVIAGF
jgi:hypothetical protein